MVKVLTLAAILSIAFLSLGPGDAMPMDLKPFLWKNRLLFVFSPDGNDPRFIKFHGELAARKPEVDDRDLVVFTVLGQGLSRMDAASLDQETVDSIRKRFAVPRNSFGIILIGKDGGIKLKQSDRTDLEAIFKLIDAMPMRQKEMRQNN